MPVPKPGSKEDQGTFMARCMHFMAQENDKKPDGQKRPQNQMVAICMGQWKNNSKASDESFAEPTQDELDFIDKFVEKYPEYASYFEEAAKKKKEKMNNGQNTTC